MPTHTCATAGVLQLLYDKYGMEYECRNWDLTDVPVDMWPDAALSVWNRARVEDMLAADAKACGVRVSSSLIDGGGRGVFSERRFAVGESLMSFCGQIVYADLMAAALSNDKKRREQVYGTYPFTTTALRWGERSVELTVGCSFWRPGGPMSSAPLKSWTVSRTPISRCPRSVWIVPDDHCVAGMVNDGRHVGVDGAGAGSSQSRPANVQLVQRFNPVLNMNHVTLPNAVELVAIADIPRGAEVYLCYGEEYVLFGRDKK